MSEIKLTIDGHEYELKHDPLRIYKEIDKEIFINDARYIAKPIPKDSKPIQDWEIVSFFFDNLRWAKERGKYYNEFGGWLDKTPSWEHLDKAEIQSVLRISDSKIFSVKDVTNYGIIQEFYIGSDGWMNVHFTDGNGATLNSIEHNPKVPLFTTEDGVEMYDYKWVAVGEDFQIWHINYEHQHSKDFKGKRFSTEEKAKEYILNNKPIQVSYKEFIDYRDAMLSKHKTFLFEDLMKGFFKSKINP